MQLTSPGPMARPRRRWGRRLFGEQRGKGAGKGAGKAAGKAAGRVVDRERVPPLSFTAAERRPDVRVVRSRGLVAASLGIGGTVPGCCRVSLRRQSGQFTACSPIRRPRSASSRNTAATRMSSRSIATLDSLSIFSETFSELSLRCSANSHRTNAGCLVPRGQPGHPATPLRVTVLTCSPMSSGRQTATEHRSRKDNGRAIPRLRANQPVQRRRRSNWRRRETGHCGIGIKHQPHVAAPHDTP